MSQPSLRLAAAPTPVEDLRRSTAAVVANPLLGTILDAVPDAVLLLNRQRETVFANRAARTLLGAECGTQLLGARPGQALGCRHAARSEHGCGCTAFCRDCGAVRAILDSYQGTPQVQECRVSLADGGALDLEVRVTPLGLEGEALTVLAIRDIGDTKRRRSLQRVFFHDLLNAAGGVRGLANLARQAQDREREELLELIHQGTGVLVEEVHAQRDLLAAEHRELPVHPEPLDPVQVLERVVGLYREHLVARGKILAVDPASEKAPLTSDPRLLRRVLGNLVKNALEACQTGETVTLGCRAEEGQLAFTVHNPGEIPAEVQRQLFQRSFSTKDSDRGLGTYGARLLTERYLGGTVECESSAPEGTTFTARYPLA